MTPSFAATLVEYQGNLYYDKVWWIVSGTVTVDTNGKITVNAVNSKEQSIQVTLGGLKQGIENAVLSGKTQKIILDGSMYIIRDNKMYNIQGARVRQTQHPDNRKIPCSMPDVGFFCMFYSMFRRFCLQE